jgi:hypothetical protein
MFCFKLGSLACASISKIGQVAYNVNYFILFITLGIFFTNMLRETNPSYVCFPTSDQWTLDKIDISTDIMMKSTYVNKYNT